MNFSNKVVWITGASSGIGEALALELSKQNAQLILSSRNRESLEKVKANCSKPELVKILPLDLEKYEQFDSIVKEALSFFETIDILVNNGGVSQRAKAIDTALAVDKRIMDINYMGTVALSKALLPYFISTKKGHFVVVTSVVGKVATPVRSAYAASKHALHGFFDSLRAETFNDGLKVTLICPGYVRTKLSFNALVGDGSLQNKMDSATDKGILPEVFAKKLMRAIAQEKREVIIGGTKETASVYLKRFFPGLLSKIIRKVNVT